VKFVSNMAYGPSKKPDPDDDGFHHAFRNVALAVQVYEATGGNILLTPEQAAGMDERWINSVFRVVNDIREARKDTSKGG
jgi:hypothetical protein